MTTPNCPDRRLLAEFTAGKLDEPSSDQIAVHLEQCADCQSTIVNLAGDQDTVGAALRKVSQSPVQPAGAAVRKALHSAAEMIPPPPSGKLTATPATSGVPVVSLTLEQFAQSLGENGIVDGDELTAARSRLSTEQREDPQALARELIAAGRLTKFQALNALQGRAKGLVFGEHIVLDRIGAGGMGQVFKAKHRRMDRIVALKVLSQAAVKNADSVKRFEREVRAAAKLMHPNIVTAFDAGQQDGTHFLVMEYVDGPDLSSLLKKRGKLPVKQACDYIAQAARGFAFAHSKGIVHRDIKPGNLLVDKDGTVRVLDMGLARFDDGGVGGVMTEGELTQSGAVMGTVDYMAPEQAMNTRNADAKSDVYGLGCSLYRLLTGESVYGGQTMVEKIMAHREQPIPVLRRVRPDAPPALEALVSRMLAKEPSLRPSMQEVADTLVKIDATPAIATAAPMAAVVAPSIHPQSLAPLAPARGEGPGVRGHAAKQKPASAAPPRKRSNTPLLAVAGAGAVLVAFGVWFIIRDKDGNEIARVQGPDGSGVQVLANGEPSGSNRAAPPAGSAAASASPTSPAHSDSPEAKTPVNAQVASTDPSKMFALPKASATASVPSSPLPVATSNQPNVPVVTPLAAATSPVVVAAPTHSRDLWIYPETFNQQQPLITVPSLHYEGGPLTIEAWVIPEVTSEMTKSSARVRLFGFDRHLQVTWKLSSANKSSRKWELTFNQLSREGRPVEIEKELGGGFETGPRHLAVVLQPRPDGFMQMQGFRDGIGRFSGGQKPINNPQTVFTSGGFITEMRISKVARYSEKFTPLARWEPDADTIALYHCDEGSGAQLVDSSGNGHHGVLTNAKWAPVGSLPGTPAAMVTTNTLGSAPLAPERGEGPGMRRGTPSLAVAPFDAAQARGHQTSWADFLVTSVETTNSVGAKMVLIPPGEFLMGSSEAQVSAAVTIAEETKVHLDAIHRIRNAEGPQHKVLVTRPYWISATEVTVGQFKKFTVATGYATEAERASEAKTYLQPGYAVADDSPAAVITWNDAVAYCNWLSAQEKVKYRLPTEAEWEYACRAGTTTQYFFGDDYRNLPKYGWLNNVAGDRSQPVAALLPNPFGLFDVHGNLHEWCGDYWDESGYAKSLAVSAVSTDPIGPADGTERVIRGGYWPNLYATCRSAYRNPSPPSYRANAYGFRVVREISSPISTTSDVVFVRPELPNSQATVAGTTAASSKLLDIADPERRAVAWAQPLGAKINIRVGETVSTLYGRKPPEEPFVVTIINFNESLPPNKEGRREITDDMLVYLTELKEIYALMLPDSQITDAGLVQLAKLTKLKGVNVLGTRVTAEGVKRFNELLPTCKVTWDLATAPTVGSAAPTQSMPAPASTGGDFWIYADRLEGNSPILSVDSIRFDGTSPLTIECWAMPVMTPALEGYFKTQAESMHTIFAWDRELRSIPQFGMNWFSDGVDPTKDRWESSRQRWSNGKLDGWMSGSLGQVIRDKPVHIAIVVGRKADKLQGLASWVDGKKGRAFQSEYEYFPDGKLLSRGSFDELRVSKVARYTADFIPQRRFEPDADTIALYHCDEGSGDKLIDASGNGHHGKLTNAKWAPFPGSSTPGTPITASTAPGLAPLAPERGERPGVRGSTAPASQIVSARQPVPEAKDQAAAIALIKDVYKDDYAAARIPEKKAPLAAKLLQQAAQAVDPVERYVLLGEARTMAADGDEPQVLRNVLAAIVAGYDVDPAQTFVDGWKAMLAKSRPAAMARVVYDDVAARFDDGVARADFDTAKKYGEFAATVAPRVGDAAVAKLVRERNLALAARQQEYTAAKAAVEKLTTAPDDAEANATIGRYRALVENDWQNAFPLLAKGSDPLWKDLAAKSVSVANDAAARAALADAWWDAAQAKPASKSELTAAALYWYQAAIAQLTGLQKARVEKRIADATAIVRPRTIPPTPLAGDSGHKGKVPK
jgi:formylglycine-generating enzyme required for sulfatase activity/serine/threonine protein kinase